MKKSLGVGAAAIALVSLGLVAVPGPAQAAGSVAVVGIAVVGDQAGISQSVIQPGIVEFHVGNTFTIPGPDGGPDTISIVRTDQLDSVLSLLPSVFTQSQDPAALAAAGQAMKAIHGITTWYGGAGKGGVWRVNLPVGNYYALGVQSTAMGMAKPVAFTVTGPARAGILPKTQMTIRAVGPVGHNKWTTRQVGAQPVEWITFANAAHEIHFMDINGVKPTTTDAMVKKGFASPNPPNIFTGFNANFDVISPGVRVAIKQALKPGKYLVDCFIPSESDGMPHALMGMWKLFDVK
jgi:hypothetical protein